MQFAAGKPVAEPQGMPLRAARDHVWVSATDRRIVTAVVEAVSGEDSMCPECGSTIEVRENGAEWRANCDCGACDQRVMIAK